MTTTTTAKACAGCGRVLPLDAFHRWARSRDGHRARCRDCRRADYLANADDLKADATRRRRAAGQGPRPPARTPDERRAARRDQSRAWRAAHPEQSRAFAQQYREQNPEAYQAAQARYRAEHREPIAAKSRAWRAANPDAQRDQARHKNHVKRAASRDTDLSRADVRAMLAAATRCPTCWEPMADEDGPRQRHVDHVVPLNVGGLHRRVNVRVICRTCNLARPKDGSDISPAWRAQIVAAGGAT